MTREPLMLAVAAMLAWAGPAVAGETSADAPPAAGCRAEPVEPALPSGEANAGPHADGGTAAPDSLTETLEPCDGVLVPPRVGDYGMTAPPPAEGRTPVIRPGDIPDQPPPGPAPE